MVHSLCNSFSVLCNTKASIKFTYISIFAENSALPFPWLSDLVLWMCLNFLFSFIQLGSDHRNFSLGTHSLSGVGLFPRAGALGERGEALCVQTKLSWLL